MPRFEHGHNHHNTAKTVMALLILIVGFIMLAIFARNAEVIIMNNDYHMFMTLAVVGAGLLVGLLYLVNNSPSGHAKAATKSSKRVKSKKK